MKISHLKEKLIFTAAYGGILLIGWYFDLPCLFFSLLGIPCPGCGMSRAWFAVCRLDIVAAFSFHPMFWSIPLLYLYFLSDNGIFHRKIPDRLLLIGIALGFAAWWCYRLISLLF